jgi:hypothetical protein
MTDALPKRMVADAVGLKKIIKGAGGLMMFIAVAMGGSYCSVAPEYRFVQRVRRRLHRPDSWAGPGSGYASATTLRAQQRG